MTKHLLEYHGGGSMQNDEDWIYLVVSEDGEVTVEHEWHHMNPYKGSVTSEGSETFSVEEFRESTRGQRLAEKLDALLSELMP